MKNIFKNKSLLFFIMIMVFFTTNVVFADGILSRGNATKKRQKKRKNNMPNKKKSKSRSIIDVSSITPKQAEEMIQKTVAPVDPAVVYEEGLAYINSFATDETASENSIKVGNYYIDIPSSMSKNDAENLVKNKLSYLLSLTMAAACNEQLNLGALALVLNTDSDYSEAKKSNEEKIRKAIERGDFFRISEQKEIKEFIKAVIMLELKSLLNPVKKESYFSSWFKEKSVRDQIKEFVKNNHILNKVGVRKTIKKAAGLDEEIGYLVTSMAYYIKKNNTLFLESPLFQDIVHAMTIPLNFKLAKIDEAATINYAAHGQMREMYKKMLKFYDISNISALQESKSARFIVQSTASYVLTKVLQGAGVLAAGALLAGGASAAKNLYYRDEGIKTQTQTESKTKEPELKELAVKDLTVKEKTKDVVFFEDVADYPMWEELGKYYDSLTPEEQKKITDNASSALGLGINMLPFFTGVRAAGGARAIFDVAKNKGSDVVAKIKRKIRGNKDIRAQEAANSQLIKAEVDAAMKLEAESVPAAIRMQVNQMEKGW
jgi:hypothetical protein